MTATPQPAEPDALERALCEQIAETLYDEDGHRYPWSGASMLAKQRYRKLAELVYRRCFQAQAKEIEKLKRELREASRHVGRGQFTADD